MTISDLIRLRKDMGYTQTEMAQAMGLGLRAYHGIEAEDENSVLSRRHQLTAERCSLTVAVERKNVMLALPVIRQEMAALMAIFRGE